MSAVKRVELGCAGHFICAKDCHWRRHTQVGFYRISSVGDMYHDGKRGTLGATKDSFFESMVFKTTHAQCADNDGCGCKEVAEWTEIDGKRYATAGEAQKGHEKFVAKYLKERAK